MAGLPLSQAIEEYLAWLELDRHASLGTVAGYRGDLRRFSDFAGGDAGIPDIAELDRDILRGYQRHLARLRTGPKGARRPLAISSRSRRLVGLRSFLRFAAREEWLPGDLGTTIDVPKLPERLPKPLEAGDRNQLLEALPHDTLPEMRDRALILLLLSTRARISEILRLDRSDWKPDRLWVLGKGDRERVVQVTDKARLAVQEYLTARVDHSPALFIGFQPASKAASSQPPHHRRRARRLPPTRPAVRDPRLSPPPAAAHPRDTAPGDDGRRQAHRRNTRPPRPGVGQWLHQNHRPASARGV
jgi:integrase/recombinase XerD